jgi:hypothetical protein
MLNSVRLYYNLLDEARSGSLGTVSSSATPTQNPLAPTSVVSKPIDGGVKIVTDTGTALEGLSNKSQQTATTVPASDNKTFLWIAVAAGAFFLAKKVGVF